MYRETHVLLDDLAEAVVDGTRKEFMESVATVPLLIVDDFGMRKLPMTAAEDLLEIVMRRYERASTLLTSNRPVEDWGKLLGDVAAVAAMLDRILHHPKNGTSPRALNGEMVTIVQHEQRRRSRSGSPGG
jgi:DNA replication protein DnaC